MGALWTTSRALHVRRRSTQFQRAHCQFHQHRDLFEETEIDLVTVDEIAESHDVKVDFLKIDVESYELYVLKGAQAVLAHAPTIVLEFVWSHIPYTGVSAEDYAD